MKTMMKKTTATLLALFLALQIVTVFADTEIISGTQGPITSFRDKLEINFDSGTCLLVGQKVNLTVTEGYKVTWSSSDENVATVDAEGLLTAVGAGEAEIYATEGKQKAKETVKVINPEQRFKVTYEVKYPSDATVQLYPDIKPSAPKSKTFTAKTAPMDNNGNAAIELDTGDYNTDNYVMTGWKAADGTVYAQGDKLTVTEDTKVTAVFEKTYDGGAQKGKSRFLATDGSITYFTTGTSDKNAPEEYKSEKWKLLSIYCYPSVDENGQAMYTFRLPEATREVRNEGEGYNLNTEDGAASRTFVGYRLLKILGVDDISAYTDKVYGISEQVTLPRAKSADGYYFAPVFKEGQTGEAQIRISYNKNITYITQGALSQEGMDALASTEWTGTKWNDKEAAIGGDSQTAVDAAYLDSSRIPSTKAILRAYGMSAENPADWEVIWYKIARTNTGYYIVGALNKNETSTENKENIVILINGHRGSVVYNGEEQSFGEYTATCNDPNFDPDKVRVVKEGGIAVSRKDCGIVQMPLDASDFAYDDPSVQATFVVSDGRLKITPATVKVSLREDIEKVWGQEDPDYNQYLVFDGLYGDDTINVSVTREEGEEAHNYRLMLYGEQDKNSNYRVQFNDGTLEIYMPPVTIRSSLEGVSSAPAGTEVTLTAEMEGLDTEHYHIQWQMGDTADINQMADIEGANDITYTYILNRETAGKYFFVVITLK